MSEPGSIFFSSNYNPDLIIHDDIHVISSQNGSLYDSCYLDGQIGDSDVEFVNFSGGGMAGAAFAGVLKDMELRGLHKPKKSILMDQWIFDPIDPFYGANRPIKYWLGSSAGAICATLAALGAPADYIIDQLINTDTRMFLDYGGRNQLNNGWNWWNKLLNYRYGIADLFSKWGIVRGLKFHQWFENQMTVLGWDPSTSFANLYDLTGQHLVITSTSLNTFETLYLSRSSYPYMKIIDAVDASMRLPYIFPPIYMNDPLIHQGKRILTDGGILNNLPINACDITSNTGEILAINRKAVGFTLVTDGKWVPDFIHIDGLLKYSLTFVQSMHTRMHVLQSSQPYFWDRVVPIETHGVGTIDFEVDKLKLRKTIDAGRKASKRFFDARAQIISEYGPLPRNLFIPNPRLRYNGIEYLSNDLIENSMIYQTHPGKFAWNKLPIERCFSC
jgi:predicted acylesterase/phospholipase RssA